MVNIQSSNLDKIIQFIKNFDTDSLKKHLLDGVYNKVSKDYFIECLEENVFSILKEKGIYQFEKVIEGTCDLCCENNENRTFSFINKDETYIDLAFQMEEGQVNSIWICSEQTNNNFNKDRDKEIYFYIDLCRDKNPIYPSYTLSVRKEIDKIIDELKVFDNQTIYLEDLEEIYKKVEYIIEEKIDEFEHLMYSYCYNDISKINSILEMLFNLKKYYPIAKEAMSEYQNLQEINEKDIIEWLLKYQEGKKFSLKNELENKGLFTFEEAIPYNITIDVSKYKVSYDFFLKYTRMYNHALNKYNEMNQEIYFNDLSSPEISIQ